MREDTPMNPGPHAAARPLLIAGFVSILVFGASNALPAQGAGDEPALAPEQIKEILGKGEKLSAEPHPTFARP